MGRAYSVLIERNNIMKIFMRRVRCEEIFSVIGFMVYGFTHEGYTILEAVAFININSIKAHIHDQFQ